MSQDGSPCHACIDSMHLAAFVQLKGGLGDAGPELSLLQHSCPSVMEIRQVKLEPFILTRRDWSTRQSDGSRAVELQVAASSEGKEEEEPFPARLAGHFLAVWPTCYEQNTSRRPISPSG